MPKKDKYKKVLRKRMKQIVITAVIQIMCVMGLIVFAVMNTWRGLYHDAKKTTTNASARVSEIMNGYENTFKSMLIPIKERIEQDITFDEMQTWLMSMEEEFREAIGEEAYDGIALTYKGGYAHSWNYGDYSNYDPTTRPWYQKAQQANGEVIAVEPYVTYLAEDSQGAQTDVLMTIAQKYNDEISFDLDLKLPQIQAILNNVNTQYTDEHIFVYNLEGQILSSTSDDMFAHNIYNADDVITEGIVHMSQTYAKDKDVLQIGKVDGKLYYLYFTNTTNDNVIGIMVPAAEIFWNNFFVVSIISLAMIAYVIYVFVKSSRSAVEFTERDHRLEVIEDAEQKERLYVDVDHMIFYGNDIAKEIAENTSYETLYHLICSRMADESEIPRLHDFLGPEVLKSTTKRQYVIDKERFLMNMQDRDGVMRQKTIEMRRLAFVQNKVNMLEISMIDAAESVDLLKEALNETERIKQEKEDEYNRFMSYICSAQDGVEELNIQEHTITRYYVKDNQLQKSTIVYPGMPFELFHEEDREKAHELYDEDKLYELCKTQSVTYAELRMKWYDAAQYHWCNVIVLGMPMTEKTPFNVLVLIKDTNEIKIQELEQKKALEDAFKMAEQGSQAKGTFLSNMSHEIRTPLNAIIGYLTIASDQQCTQEKKNYCIENCQTASKHLLQIINDILDMSSIENGKLKIAHEEFDLKKEIADITSIFYQNAKIKKVKFETHVENVTEEWVIGDQLRLNQVLMNLLSNAVKFTPEDGTVLLGVEQLRKDNQRVYMRFTVKDTGIGMSKEYMSRIFTPFEQENAGTAKKFGGSGLGLSITNNLVQMMGGKIDVQSEQNQGTTFDVTMFFEVTQTRHDSNIVTDYSHLRILVVDDKEDECSYIKMMLKRCGVKADTVTDGAMALKKIQFRKGGDYSYDLCIIDWNMPGMNGCEVTSKIRSELGEKMPIIIATAYDTSEFEEEAKNAGVDKIIAKPLFQSTLFDLLVSSFGSYDPEPNKEKTEQIDLTGIHLILAEDNPMNMDIAVTILEKAGIVVTKATNGQEAVDLFLNAPENTFDLILMDVQMPVVDGYEATAKIRKSDHPEAHTIPIIAMTANAFAEDVAEALANGMDAHIAKPISYDKLFAVLKKFTIDKKRR